MVDATPKDFVRTMPLNRGDHNVIDLDRVGHGYDGTRRRLDYDWLVVEAEIADIFNASFRQIIQSFSGFCEPRAFPSSWRLAGNCPDRFDCVVNCTSLIFNPVHWPLDVAVSDEIPAGCKGCPASFLVQRTGCAVHREARLQATRVESLQKSPEPDSHPVFVPRPIWHVGQERLAHGRGQHCPGHGISRAPVLHVHDCPDRHPRISGQTQLRARHDWPIRKAVANCRRHYRGVPKSPTGNWSTGLVGPDSPQRFPEIRDAVE